MSQYLLWILITLAVLVLIVALRIKFNDKLKLSTSDMGIALIPFIIWLIMSGKISELSVGDVSFKTTFEEVQQKKIDPQTLTNVDVNRVPSALKAGTGQIGYIASNQTEALIFKIGYDNYSPEAIQEYFTKLLNSSLKYIIFNNINGDFVGIIQFSTLVQQTMRIHGDGDWGDIDKLTEAIINKKTQELLELKGFIGKNKAATFQDSRADILARAVGINSSYLPVVDKEKFVGVITQDRINSIILLELYKHDQKAES